MLQMVMSFLGMDQYRGKKSTFKAYKMQSNEKRIALSTSTRSTLGTGNVRDAVKLPDDEQLEEWLAANTVDFFNEISLVWGLVVDASEGVPDCPIGEGFPPGFEYRWTENTKKAPIRTSGPDYVDKVLTWIEAEINDPALFPTVKSAPFPRHYINSLKQIFCRMFRIYAIVYCCFFSQIDSLGAGPHLNTSFKHFMFFAWEFDLVKASEFEAIQDIVEELKKKRNSIEYRQTPVMPLLRSYYQRRAESWTLAYDLAAEYNTGL